MPNEFVHDPWRWMSMKNYPRHGHLPAEKALSGPSNAHSSAPRILPSPGMSPTLFPKSLLAYQTHRKCLLSRDGQALPGRRYLTFGPLSQTGNNVLPFEHASQPRERLSSAMQAYLTLGRRRCIWRRRPKTVSTCSRPRRALATGGWGPDEAFGEPGVGQLGNSLVSTHASL